jgi:hypothetical protein
MSSPPVDLFIALHRELETRLAPIPVERRYMPRVDSNGLDILRVAVYMEATENEEITRGFGLDRWTFGIAVQKSFGNSGAVDCEGDPVLDGIDNLAQGDEVISQMELIKDLWRDGGELRDLRLAGHSFIELVHDPVYEPVHLLYYDVFSSIIDVTYQST